MFGASGRRGIVTGVLAHCRICNNLERRALRAARWQLGYLQVVECKLPAVKGVRRKVHSDRKLRIGGR